MTIVSAKTQFEEHMGDYKKQKTVAYNENGFEDTDLEIEGRHDVCLCPRIVPVVEAMTWLVLTDMYLRQKSVK